MTSRRSSQWILTLQVILRMIRIFLNCHRRNSDNITGLSIPFNACWDYLPCTSLCGLYSYIVADENGPYASEHWHWWVTSIREKCNKIFLLIRNLLDLFYSKLRFRILLSYMSSALLSHMSPESCWGFESNTRFLLLVPLTRVRSSSGNRGRHQEIEEELTILDKINNINNIYNSDRRSGNVS